MNAASTPPASVASAADLLAVAGLGKSYGRRRVLDGVSFSVRPGEVLGLVGPNGAGKTTLFGCLAGLLPADAGRVADGSGRTLPPAGRRDLLFYLPDGILPWPEQCVNRILARWRDLWGGPDSRQQASRALLERLGLVQLRSSPVGALSKGERKRFLLALALFSPRPLLLLDEPFDGLDLRQTRDVAALLAEVAAEGRTLFLSIHQLVDAGRVCDRFVMLADGKVAGAGTLDALRERAGCTEGSLEEVFLALT
ncbi:MAG TPA: ABC transporter ATP-binding protein [Thermoanaerobaculia bacterium]|jgi:ABC-type multidrug transport system ATPase subunit|nr:ABC transporter ATP-binding protein [Thermoanaerobaculia bacterium]